MPVKLRLQRFGSKKRPFYFIVAADTRSPRDGKSIEKLGTYNPLTVPATITLDNAKAIKWLENGAQATPTVQRILSFKGVLFYKHLLRGVKKGLFDLATANQKFEKWLSDHEAFIAKTKENAAKKKVAQAPKPVAKPVATPVAVATENPPTEQAPTS